MLIKNRMYILRRYCTRKYKENINSRTPQKEKNLLSFGKNPKFIRYYCNRKFKENINSINLEVIEYLNSRKIFTEYRRVS